MAFDGYNIDYPHSYVGRYIAGPGDGPLITENYNYRKNYIIYYRIWKSDRVRHYVGEPRSSVLFLKTREIYSFIDVMRWLCYLEG